MSEKDKKKMFEGISRREFLRDAGILAGGAAIGSTVILAACGGEVTKTATTTIAGPTKTVTVKVEVPEKLTKLTVNGETQELKIEPNWTLLDVLRDKLYLTGAKLSCDKGECGCCTVIIDGRPILSCMILADTCEGKNITTIEALADPVTKELHLIQKAFKENGGMQCGFCTPGIIMSAKALLDRDPEPTIDEVKVALSGVLCRCGNYSKIFESVLAASK